MNDHIFQLIVMLGNGLACVAFWALKQEVKHVKDMVEIKLEDMERRLERVENKCQDCPSHH